MTFPASCTAFADAQRIASGPPVAVAAAIRRHMNSHPEAAILIFDDDTAQPVEFDLRGSERDVTARIGGDPPHIVGRGRGRPKLGVVAREVTLLPRHWEWLAGQPGGASVALRKLVDAARAANVDKDRKRAAQTAVHRFMTAMAGNLTGYEDTLRALYAGDRARFEATTAPWPADVRAHTLMLAADAL